MNKSDKRRVLCRMAEIISEYGKDGISKSDLINEIYPEFQDDFSEENLIYLLRVNLPEAIGNIVSGARRWAKYVIDDKSVAIDLINDYYNSKMTELEKWLNFEEACDFIESDNHCTRESIERQFGCNMDKIDEELAKYNAGLDYYKVTSHGTRVRLGENTRGILNGIISELENAENEPEKSKVEKPKTKKLKMNTVEPHKSISKASHLVEMTDEDRKIVMRNIVEILYARGSSMTINDIRNNYYKKFGAISYDSVECMLKRMKGLRRTERTQNEDDKYSITNLNECLYSISPYLAKVRIEVAIDSSINVDEYANMELIMNIGEKSIYLIEDDNSHDLYAQLFTLWTKGAKFSDKITSNLIRVINDSLKSTEKSIIILPS
jgi:archaellum component FlaD/FlaE